MITVKSFGTMADGHNISLYTLQVGPCSLTVSDLGATLVQLSVPDRQGVSRDVVLGYDSVESYLDPQSGYMGATVGRYANRIAESKFYLRGKLFHLTENEGLNHLHGGKNGFSFRLFSVKETNNNSIRFSLFSPDGDEGYPGNMNFSVEYALTSDGLLTVSYDAVCDQDTVVNFTNHSYFNLNGADSGRDILNHRLTVNADYCCNADKQKIPKGDMFWLYGSSMDFSTAAELSDRLQHPVGPLAAAKGLDHHFAFNGLLPNITLSCPDTGIAMDIRTSMPGAQIYTGQNLPLGTVGKGGVFYPKYAGICLETQNYPNAPNVSNFPSAVLRAQTPYHAETKYQFRIEEAKSKRRRA